MKNYTEFLLKTTPHLWGSFVQTVETYLCDCSATHSRFCSGSRLPENQLVWILKV